MTSEAATVSSEIRFNPTDLELITDYLEKETAGKPLAPSPITTRNDVYNIDPSDLPDDDFKHGSGREAYYFAIKKIVRGRRKHRSTGGIWRASGGNKTITNSLDVEVGHRKHLAYYRDGAMSSSNWIMYEYRLGSKEERKTKNKNAAEELFLCRIKYNEPRAKKSLRDGDHVSQIRNDRESSSAEDPPYKKQQHDQDTSVVVTETTSKKETAAATEGSCAFKLFGVDIPVQMQAKTDTIE